MDHIRVQAGRITGDVAKPARNDPKLEAVVAGIPIRKFVVNGGEHLQLGHIDQEELSVYINGPGTVSGDGKVQNLTLVLNGPGTADLGDLQVGDANLSLLGPGKVTLSPHGDVKLFVAGNAMVRPLTQPSSIKRRIIGPAVIQTPEGSEINPPPVAPRPPAPAIQATPATPPGAAPMQMQVPMPNVDVKAIASAAASAAVAAAMGAARDRVVVNGKRNVDLGHIDQDHLSLRLNGDSSVTAEGRVDALDLTISGDGNANLGRLAARSVVVHISGSGNAVIAPAEDLEAHLTGSGNIRLVTRPAHIERHVRGKGNIVELP